MPYEGVKVFSATKAKDREVLGETVTAWIRQNPVVVTGTELRQSSDREFPCMSITIFFNWRKDGTEQAKTGNAPSASKAQNRRR